MTAILDAPSPPSEARWLSPVLAVLAAAIGLAAAYADGVTLDPIKAAGALLLAAPAYLGFLRTTRRIAGESGSPTVEALFSLVLPAAFLLLLVSGTDHLQRGDWSWTAFAAGVPFALIATCVPLVAAFTRREADLAAGRSSLATAITPMHDKLWLFGIAMPAYLWLVLQVGRDSLPQGCAAAVITVLLSLRAANALHDNLEDGDEMPRALRFAACAAPVHGLILAVALAFDSRWLSI